MPNPHTFTGDPDQAGDSNLWRRPEEGVHNRGECLQQKAELPNAQHREQGRRAGKE